MNLLHQILLHQLILLYHFDFQLPKDIKFPNVELGNAEFVYREDGKTTYVAAVKNQNDIKEFVDKIYQKIGETNP